MKVAAIKTHSITSRDTDLFRILDRYVVDFPNKSVLAVASKIVAIAGGSVVPMGSVSKKSLIGKEADYTIPGQESPYGITLTIKNNILIPSAGIDESNGNGFYILWPKKLQKTANAVREYLVKRFKIRYAGVIITDSRTTPLRWGTTGIALAHSGFAALRDYRGKIDLFGNPLKVTQSNIADGLAAAAVAVMGEGSEQTPLVVVEDTPFVDFQDRIPTNKELKDLAISIEEDLYAPILTKAGWKKTKKGKA